MKMSRDALKVIVKECLVEILAEGLGEDALVEATAPRQKRQLNESQFSAVAEAAQKRQRALKSRPAPDGRRPNIALKQAVLESAGGNPVLQDIFADTAMTTLQQQNQYESRGPAAPVGAVEMAIADAAPAALFGEDNAEKWAQLAFMDNRPGAIAKKSS